MRLSEHLSRLGLSNAEAKKALRAGKVFFHGIPTADGGREVEPYQVLVQRDAPKLTPGRDLVIVHKDDDLVVVWKPAGLLSVRAGKDGGHLNALGLVGKLTGRPVLPVHRLDQDTSGLMMMARHPTSQEALKAQLEVHDVERRYVALVLGKSQSKTWTVSNHLVEDRGDGLRGSIEAPFPPFAKHAKTRFTALQRINKRVSLIEAQLETGRTHQVRIHLSEDQLPILGDQKYGTAAAQRLAQRLCLHAIVLGIEHPKTGEKIRFTSPLPDDMEQLRRGLVHDARNPTLKRTKSKIPKKRRRPKT
jgi:23S rRNA pseudouridine1911/1915/1917 synthase